MLGFKPAVTPVEPNVKLEAEDGKEVDQEQYQRLVGKQSTYPTPGQELPLQLVLLANSCSDQGKTSGCSLQNSQIVEEYSWKRIIFQEGRSQDDRSIYRCLLGGFFSGSKVTIRLLHIFMGESCNLVK